MTHEEKINYMKIATGIVGYGFNSKDLDMFISIYELVIKEKGKTDLKMICEIQSEVEKRADTKSRSELLDKVSKKVY